MTPDTARPLSPAEMDLVARGAVIPPDPPIDLERRRLAWADERVPNGLKWLKSGKGSRPARFAAA